MRAILASALLVLASSPFMAHGAATSNKSTHDADTVVPVTLGQSVIALTGPWKFHVGDDPQWADPGFDDSQWESVDLTPTPQTTVPGVPFKGFVTGWQARGHPGYAGFAWYRLRVRISGTSGPLTLLGPAWFEGGYQIFVNGRPVGSFGDFTRKPPELYYPNPASFTVPASDYEHTSDGTELIALRFYTPADALVVPAMGGMHVPPRIGLPSAAASVFHVEWETEYWRLVSALVTALVYFFFALLIAMIFAFSRTDKILLWPLAACIFFMIYTVLIFSTNTQWLSYIRLTSFIGLAGTLGWYMWMLAWRAYFGLQRKRWLFKAIVAVGVVDLIQTQFFIFAKHAAGVSHGLSVAASVLSFAINASQLLITATIALLGWKSPVPSKWPLYLVLMFYSLPDFVPLASLLHLRYNWLFFGVQFPFALLCVIAMLFFFSIVLFQQFRASLQRKQAMEDDVKQAKQIQQLLIPEQQPAISGFRIESEYRPAREVGGDFFQIVPNRADGSLLIVAGDVTGKGLQAGMLVAMLVGAIRTESAHTSDPTRILCALNARLQGREHAQATCLALHISADGNATLSNAGHIAPYLNSEPLPMEGALPLGMIEAAEFSVMKFKLNERDKLVLMSDGIAEAMDANGQLFGFERIHDLMRTTCSAAAVAAAAQTFGQEDDISVIAITRTAMLEPVTA